MVRWVAGMIVVASVSGIVTTQGTVPADLTAMADTEREFARTATVKGWRDAFLDFFADDSIAFAPDVTSAKERLKTQPSRPFSEIELVWEPRTGDVASSGDLGWLTGPSTSTDRTQPEPKPRYGCYLSVWRKQPDGRWRVFIDVGANSPEPVPFSPGFTRVAFGDRYAGKEGKQAAGTSLAEADRSLDDDIAAQGTVKAFGSRLTPASRLHRPGSIPIIGREASMKWLAERGAAGTATHSAAEASAAGDFGYTYGRFTVTGAVPLSGVYVRLWSRDAAGRWWLMADVAQPFK